MKLIVHNIYNTVSSRNKKTSFDVTFRYIYMYIYDVLSSIFYLSYLFRIKDSTDAPKWANYLNLRLEFD